MTYFSNLPNTDYELQSGSFLVKDITKRSKFITEVKPYTGLFTEYEIRDSDTIYSIAKRYYGSEFLYWVIAVFNEIHNMYTDWPLTQSALDKLCVDKYGIYQYAVKHWTKDGVIIGEIKEYKPAHDWIAPQSPESTDQFCIPVTFFEYETRLNEDKRIIKILSNSLLSEFISQFKKSFNER